MFNLSSHVASKPIMDAPFKRHLRTDPIFQEVQHTRQAEVNAEQELLKAMDNLNAATDARKAAEAKASLMASMEDLDNE